MDEELESLAAQALCNAFWHDFSTLVNKYLKMGKGDFVKHAEAARQKMKELTDDL